MDALDLLTVLCGVSALGAAVALTLLCSRVLRLARALEDATAEFDQVATRAAAELAEAARDAADEVARVEDLLDVAGSIGGRVDAATEATYHALTSPVIKGVAIASGTRRVARRLRTNQGPPQSAPRTAASRAGSRGETMTRER